MAGAVPPPRLSVAEILRPRSVAIVGASEDARKFGGRVLRNVLHHRFPGTVYPINPNRPSLLGLPAYPRIAACPAPPDVAVVAVPREHLIASVEDCAAGRVGCCVVITSGLGETGVEGAAIEARMLAVARGAGMRILGPNCLGFISPYARLALNSSPAMEVTALEEGAIAFVSQSGALMATLFNRAAGEGLAFSVAVSIGNQLDLEAADMLEVAVADAHTRAVCLYLEGITSPARFLAAAEAARAAGKPVFLLKAGRSAAGARTALSHTGSLAGSAEVLQAVAREAGIVLADDLDAMARAAGLAVRHDRPGPGGLAVVSPSGGGAAITADRAADLGVPLAALAPGTRAALVEHIVESQIGNPLDLGASKRGVGPEAVRLPTAVLAGAAETAATLAVISTAPMLDEMAVGFADAFDGAGKAALAVMLPGTAGDAARAVLRARGVVTCDRLDDALRALALWFALREERRIAPAVRPAGLALPSLPAHERLTAPEAAALVRSYGVPTTAERMAATRDEAMAAARVLGFPVAMKAVARALLHKTEAGAVKLGIADEAGAAAAWDALAPMGDAGVLVQRMEAGEAELIVGARRDPDFGAVVLVGFGGVLAELAADTVLARAPVSPEAARAMLERLRMAPVLKVWRGRPPLDVAAAAEAVSRLSWLAADLGNRLGELEINPLMVRAEGAGVVAVDARAILATPA